MSDSQPPAIGMATPTSSDSHARQASVDIPPGALSDASTDNTQSKGQSGGSGDGVPTFLRVLPRGLMIIYFVLLFIWIWGAEGGLGTDFLSIFGMHGLFMSIFVVFAMQESLLTFVAPVLGGIDARTGHPILVSLKRAFRGKNCHVMLHFIGVVCCMVGLAGIIQYKALAPSPTVFPFYSMYSPHSWLAVTFLSLWGMQWALGLYVFWWDPSSYSSLAKYHRFLGRVVYVTGLAVCALGLADMQSSDLAGSVPPYVNTVNFTQDQIDGMGYYPDSAYARYSSFMVLLLLFQGILVFIPKLK